MTSAPKPPDFFTKTGLHLEPIPSNEELWATGLVTHLWTIWENHLTEYGRVLTMHDPAARKVFRKQKSLKTKARMVREMILYKVKPEYRTAWISLVNRGGSLQIQRDRIVHWDWTIRVSDTSQQTGPKVVSDWFRGQSHIAQHMDYDSIFGIARQIDKLLLDCLFFRLELMLPSDGGDLRPALLRRLLAPDRPLTRLHRLLSYLPIRTTQQSRPEP